MLKDFITWEELAVLVERAAKTRRMTRGTRNSYREVVAELREQPLAGRRCSGCDGPILQRPVDNEGTVTFDYDCTCPGSEPLDKSLPWSQVPEREKGLVLE